MSRRPDPREPERSAHAELAGVIDRAAVDKPTFTQLLERLKQQGVTPVPSIQASGRLNGMSYQYRGALVKGSDIGRAYTAQGLQQRHGIDYRPDRDDIALRARVQPGAGTSTGDREYLRRDRVRNPYSDFSADQRRAFEAIGKFRTVNIKDLGGERIGRLDVQSLINRGFAQRQVVTHVRTRTQYSVVVLTKAGRNYLRKIEKQKPEAQRQQYYAGFVKPAEVRHDLGVYRMYQMEKERIEREGGTVKRVVLDFELKRKLFSEMNRAGGSKRAAAEKYDIRIINGKLAIPDCRIEFETRDQKISKVDLELTTGDYKPGQLAAKEAAGFKMYRSGSGGIGISAPHSGAGAPAQWDPEHVADLLSL